MACLLAIQIDIQAVCTGAKATFDARDKSQDLIIEELEDSDYDDFGK